MSFTGSAMTMAIALKLMDDMSGPLQGAVNKAKTALDGLSKAGEELGKIKLFETTKAELDKLGKQLEEAKKQRDFFVESAAKGGDAGAALFATDIAKAKGEVLELAAAVEKKKTVLREAGQALRDAGVDVDNLGDRVSELSKKMEREAKFDALQSRLKDVAANARAAGERLESVGRQSMAGGAAIGAGVGATVTSFADQETATARLKAAMSTSEGVSKNFERVQALTIELGNRLPGNTADFANMATALLQLGVSEEAVLGGVGEAAANLAVVMRLPYEEAAEIAAKLKEATGTAETDMMRLMDVIQRTGAQGVQSGEMMMAFSHASGAMKQYNIQGVGEAEKMAAIYAQLIKSGASGETVGTGMAAILGRLREFDSGASKNAKDAAESLKSMGISMDFFDDKTGEFRGVDNLIAQLDKLKGLDQQRLGDVISKIAGTGQDAQFVAQLALSGTAGNQAMKDRMAGTGDINAKVDIQLATLASKWEAATGTFGNLLAEIGGTMAPKLGVVVEWFGKISESAMALVRDNKELFGWLGLGATAVAGTLVAGGALALGLGTVAKLFGGITEGMAVLAKIGPVLGGVTDTLTKWGPQLAKSLQTVGAATATVIRAHPILAAIFGAVAIGFLVYDNRKAISAGIKSIVDGFSELFGAITGSFKTVGTQIMSGLMEGIQDGLRWVQGALRKVGLDLPESLKKVLDIRSPSRVFMAIGRDIGRGLAIGIADSEEAVRAAVDGLGKVAIYAGDAATLAMIRDQERAIAEMASAPAPTPASAPDPVSQEVVPVEKSGMRRDRLGRNMASEDAAALDDLQEKYGSVSAAASRYHDSIGRYADNLRNTWERAFKGMEDALVSFVKTGKLDFRGLADSIVSDLIRIQVQESITKPLAGAMKSMDWSSLKFWADGGVPGGQSISAWRNQVVDQPTLFAFAKGAGVFGEAGPEAIMPLTRGPDGRLGVQASGGAGGVTVTQHITVNAQGADAGVDQKIYLAMRRAKDEAVAAVAEQFRRGGPMARAVRSA
jgi:TP901 family phage tail tape measure protein